ncbi:MAG: SprT-like domain-containing protein [Sphingobacteriaceae bacterium]
MDKIKVLEQYLPPQSAPLIARWIDHFQCEFKVSRTRSTKFGDYRAPFGGQGHRISINYDLNTYAFLVTTVHEFAHLLTWNEHKRKAKPHGAEWKANFKRMMRPFFEQDVFPPDIRLAITRYLENPAASSCTDHQLFKALKKYDATPEHLVLVEAVPLGSCFKLKDGRVFKKDAKIRKRFRCTEIATQKIYLFSPLAEVELMI